MASVEIADTADLDGFRRRARVLLAAEIAPDAVVWRVGDATPDLFAVPEALQAAEGTPERRVPRAFLPLAQTVLAHADPGRFALLYRLLWRVTHAERDLLVRPADPDMADAERLIRAVRHETHKMHAFVRFREVQTSDGSWFVAWFEPVHHIVERAAPFFARRFATMRWSILTPRRSVYWDLQALHFGPGASRADAPADDALEEHWRIYFASIFNPARLNPALMRRHMPERYWRNLPEASTIAPLIAEAGRRTSAMIENEPKAPAQRGRVALPAHADHVQAEHGTGHALDERPASLAAARAGALRCRACPLWEPATQTVFGEGPADAPVMILGEQPGDQEDLAGRPFVGPAGQLFDRALNDARIDRAKLYITNAVKHFKFTPRGRRRIHQKPTAGETDTCRWWVDLERTFVQPRLIVAMGATAGRSLLGRDITISRERGEIRPFAPDAELLVTPHPSFILRLPDRGVQAAEYRRLVSELALLAPYLDRAAA